jgi:hypothetical protein
MCLVLGGSVYLSLQFQMEGQGIHLFAAHLP